jgi:hypothetical protein
MGKHADRSGRTGNNDQDNGKHRDGKGFAVGGHTAGREKSSNKGWNGDSDGNRNEGEDVMRKRGK